MRKEVLKRVSRILRFACMTAWVSVGIGCEELDDTITSDPYAGGKEPFDIACLPRSPCRRKGIPGIRWYSKPKGF